MNDKTFRGLTISDWASLANLVVAIVAIIISLYVFAKQSKADEATAAVLKQSRDSLKTAARLLDGEQAKLKRVTQNLAVADDALSRLESHAKRQVEALDAADDALKRVVKATNAQYNVDQRILGESRGQLSIVKAESAARVAALAAAPKIEMSLQYAKTRDVMYIFPPYTGPKSPTYGVPVGPEQVETYRVRLVNVGNAPAPSPTLIIASQDLDVSGCMPLYSRTIQCDGENLHINQAYVISFNINAPRTAGTHFLTVRARTTAPTDKALEFISVFKLYIPAVPG